MTAVLVALLAACLTVAAIIWFDRTETESLTNVVEDRTLTRWVTVHLERARDTPTPEQDYARIHEWIYSHRHEIDQQGYELTCEQMMDEFPDIVEIEVTHGGQYVGCCMKRGHH